MEPLRVDVHIHGETHEDDRLDRVLRLLGENMALLDALTEQVKANTTVIGSALVLINGFAAKLAAAGTDPVALAALQAELKTNDDALAAAVVANTPAV